MPAKSPRHAIARQWELLHLLPYQPQGKTTAELAQELKSAGYEVTKRTVERDLCALEGLFPVTHEEEQPYRWQRVKDSSLKIDGLKLADALSIHLLHRFVEPLLPSTVTRQLGPLFSAAAKQLKAQGESGLGRWPDKVAVVSPSIDVVPPQIDKEVFRTVQEALLLNEKFEAGYRRTGAPEAKKMVLNPLGLVVCGPQTYLVAAANEHREPVLFAMHRMKAARRLHEPASELPGFDLSKYIDAGALQFGASAPLALRARLSPVLARQLQETRLSPDQQIRQVPGQEGFELTATVKGGWRLEWWLLSKTGDLEVLEPADLRERIGKTLAEAARSYVDKPLGARAAPLAAKTSSTKRTMKSTN